ncbi:tRNA1(Val) (adenine(37)-N6)-methyltransferase [compost metagenome]
MLRQEDLYSHIIDTFISEINSQRVSIGNARSKTEKLNLGQFFTEPKLALFIANMFHIQERNVRLLDPGAGIGILTFATIIHLCSLESLPETIDVVAIELDDQLIPTLTQTLEYCERICTLNGVNFTYSIIQQDFIEYCSLIFNQENGVYFNKVITNPPYKKINSSSATKRTLKLLQIESTNLYTAFLSLSKRLLVNNGELIAITPRSFCNGPYFRPFRFDFLNDMSFTQVHLFNSRKNAFRDDDVLQENIIFRAIKNQAQTQVTISSSDNITGPVNTYLIDYDHLIHPTDPNSFIHILKDEEDLKIRLAIENITSNLNELGLQVSTGRVVDFRTLENLKDEPDEETVPLIYPFHFNHGYIKWPVIPADKPNAILNNEKTIKSLVPNGNYVLIRRFSSKEEPRRIVPAIVTSDTFNATYLGFENHINFFHINGSGMPLNIAKGLALYLSTTLIDRYFRQFNGHTQVNVGDLKILPYPSFDQLQTLGTMFDRKFPEQQEVDRIVGEILNII